MAKETFKINRDPRVFSRAEGTAPRGIKARMITEEYSDQTGELFHNELQELCDKYGVNVMIFLGIRHMKVGNKFATDFLGDRIGLSPVQEQLYHQARYALRELEDQAFHVLGLLTEDSQIIDERRLVDFITGQGEFKEG